MPLSSDIQPSGARMPFSDDEFSLAGRLGQLLVARNLILGVAESCTGGLLGHLLTSVSGSSNWFTGGVIAYSNAVKTALLGVGEEIIAAHGAVSQECVLAMAGGICRLLGVCAGVAVSGIAGPSGGTPEKPVGTVCFAWVVCGKSHSETAFFRGNRLEIKTSSALYAVEGLLRIAG